MTGFIRNLFGGNKRSNEPKQRSAYFLSEDDAKTFGDIDYMRSEKVVRRTFAKKKGQTEELESVRRISAMGRQDLDERGISTSFERKAEPAKPTFESARKFKDTKVDSDMDMFRNMAKNIKKK
ncbi:MAG: hypothetical protein AAFX01_05810 [Cyanobacteria bacterium J06638_28]